jgi:8-oxo-dGTP diphosphatase
VIKDIHSDLVHPADPSKGKIVPCVGAVITDGAGRLLLVRRGHAPDLGLWSLPGGRVEAGETDAQALVRELREETGLVVRPTALLGSVERPGIADEVFLIRDYTAVVTGGSLTAGDDAAAVRWVSAGELASLPLTSGLVETLASWGVLLRGPVAGLLREKAAAPDLARGWECGRGRHRWSCLELLLNRAD